MNQSISNEENYQKRVKRYRQKLHIPTFKMCRATKRPFTISEKGDHRFENKCYGTTDKIMHMPKLHKIPHHDEIQEEHDRAYQYIPHKLYDIFMSTGKDEK